MTITVLSKDNCVQCNATYRRLDSTKVEYGVEDIYENLDVIQPLGYMAAPVVLVRDADGELVDHWAGFRPDKIEALAEQAKAA
ncbi:NrdH-like glutaredoxin [Microbacterium phage Cece]|nr:NrdH-like glutaredoxin [Microbacterium phage Cece]